MQRRSFLRLSAMAGVFAMVPYPLKAVDFRDYDVKFWDASTVPQAIKAMYGDKPLIESDKVKLIAHSYAANNLKIPVNIQSDIDAKSVSLYQDSNPQSAVGVWTLNKYSVIDFQTRVKVQSLGDAVTFTLVVEGNDGKLYFAKHRMTVAKGGCIDEFYKSKA